MGFFDWRSTALVSSLYLVLAIFMISLAYPKSAFEGLVVPSGFRVTLYNNDPVIAVFASGSSTFIYWSGSVYSLPFPVSSACYDGSDLFMVVGGNLFIVDSRGAYTMVRFDLNASLTGVICGRTSYAVLASSGGLLLVDLEGGVGFRFTGFQLDESISGLQVREGVYVASGNRVAFISGGRISVYELPSAALIRGLTLSHDGLVAYGSWGDAGLVYRFSVGEALLVSVPGRTTSVEAMSCSGYRCIAIVRPYGDWLIAVEFSNWRYVSHARIAAVKPFIYHGSGTASGAWISGELVDLGVLALGVSSTREAVVGFNSTHAVVWTESYIAPAPRISKVKIHPSVESSEIEIVEVKLSKENGSLQQGGIVFKVVEPQVDRLSTLTTLTVIALPALVYLYSFLIARGGRTV